MLKKLLLCATIISLVLISFENNAKAARSPKQQAQAILQTGMIYGQMAAENISKYIKSLEDSNDVKHGSDEIRAKIKAAHKNAAEAIKMLNKALKDSNAVLSNK